MLDVQFIGLNIYFAVHLLAALVCFAMFWLTFDAYTVRHAKPELIKWLGFLALAIGFLAQAATLQLSGGTAGPLEVAAQVLRILGYAGVILAQLLEPLQPRPTYNNDDLLLGSAMATEPAEPQAPAPSVAQTAPIAAAVPDAAPDTTTAPAPKTVVKVHAKPAPRKPKSHAFMAPFTLAAAALLPLLAAGASALYWRRATVGLERHLAPVGLGLGGLALFEVLGQTRLLQSTDNPMIYRLVATYGPAWWLMLAVLLASSLILGRWVWRYLTKRIQSQLFMILVCQALALFMISTVGFTALLLQNIRTQSSADLATASKVLGYAVSGRQAETAAQAEAVAATSAVASAVSIRDHAGLAITLDGYLASRNLSSLIITDATAQVLLRGEDSDRWGDSISSNPLIRRALVGEASSSISASSGTGSPTVTILAASPIRDSSGLIVGAVITGRALSGAFVDGVRASTGLDSTVYAGNVRAATTLVRPGSSERAIGVKEPSQAVNDQVLSKNKSYSGAITIQNRSYLAAFTPLRDINNTPVGMLMAARPADAIYTTANRSIQLTFLLMVSLTFLAIYPVFLISRYLSAQIK